MASHLSDPAPLSGRQLRALAASSARELVWGLRLVKAEHARWCRRAAAISDPAIRGQMLEALRDKRALVDGAALFWTIPDRRQPELLRLLVAFQVLANTHDHASERAAAGIPSGPAGDMGSLVEAVDLHRPPGAYEQAADYDDGGYLATLAGACRAGCRSLAHYESARSVLVREVQRGRTLDFEHEHDGEVRRRALQRIAEREYGDQRDMAWFELTAGASSLLTAIAVLAVAADGLSDPDDVEQTVAAYLPAASISALLDNYVDAEDDARLGQHNHLNYYPSQADAVRRLAELTRRATRSVGALRHGARHQVIVASMVALYLSGDAARARPRDTAALAASAGALTRLLVPVLRTWRTHYGETHV
ncbi:Tetraprenyl-beta-curcumene synthase [Baekduia alba]|uniref:DUF2600 family protein n=1 Tax=Baekduia alba TaxID=2997333 RepID=UPI00233FB479|nr:DUF2600 family protein [Baekduia alba]WCB96405.1 Tetraprenyl-beta-curcumene synthase [Baekduia alba]